MNILLKKLSGKSQNVSSFSKGLLLNFDKCNFSSSTQSRRTFIKGPSSSTIINTAYKVKDLPRFGAPPKNKIQLKFNKVRIPIKIEEER